MENNVERKLTKFIMYQRTSAGKVLAAWVSLGSVLSFEDFFPIFPLISRSVCVCVGVGGVCGEFCDCAFDGVECAYERECVCLWSVSCFVILM